MEIGRTEAVSPWRSLIAAAGAFIASALLLATIASDARAQVIQSDVLADGAVRTEYRIGPLDITPGQNRINYRPVTGASVRP